MALCSRRRGGNGNPQHPGKYNNPLPNNRKCSPPMRSSRKAIRMRAGSAKLMTGNCLHLDLHVISFRVDSRIIYIANQPLAQRASDFFLIEYNMARDSWE
jgi:hypothetical protein